MTVRVAVVGEPGAASLAGLPEPSGAVDLTVLLGGTARAPSSPWLLWREDGPSGEEWKPPPLRVLGQGDEPLWRRAPWPVADDVFGLALPERPAVAVVMQDEYRRAGVVDRLAADAETIECERLTREELRRASVVIMGSAAGRFPARAFAVLAARRVLVIDQVSVAFGLLPGRDHVQAPGDAAAAEAALSVVRHTRAFHWMRTLGTLAAERQRASRVYTRLAADLALEGRRM